MEAPGRRVRLQRTAAQEMVRAAKSRRPGTPALDWDLEPGRAQMSLQGNRDTGMPNAALRPAQNAKPQAMARALGRREEKAASAEAEAWAALS